MLCVVLIGGTRLYRDGLKSLLEEGGTEVVGAYASIEAVELRDRSTAPVVYLLIASTGHRGIRQAIDDLRHADPKCRIAVMLSRLAADDLMEVFAAGGDGLVLEEISAPALRDSLRLVDSGEKVFPSQLVTLLRNDRKAGPMLPQSPLTKRELEIVERLGLGQSNKEIANDLSLALATVKVHVKSLLRKLGLNNRTQAAIWALNSGLVDPPEVTVEADGGLGNERFPPKEPKMFTDGEDICQARPRIRRVAKVHASHVQEGLKSSASNRSSGGQGPDDRTERSDRRSLTSPRPLSIRLPASRGRD